MFGKCTNLRADKLYEKNCICLSFMNFSGGKDRQEKQFARNIKIIEVLVEWGEKQSQIAVTILLHEVPNETSLQFNIERGKEIFHFDF